MEVTEKITLDMLTKEGVSVLRQKFININDVEVQVGENVRNAFTNCEDDRKILKEQLSEDYYNAVWQSGDFKHHKSAIVLQTIALAFLFE